MSIKERLIAAIIAREGGYSNHAGDSGGETMFGITAAVARKHGYTGAMRDLPRTLAERIIGVEYCDAIGLEKVERLSPAVAEELADTAVNMGPVTAGKFLQRALNVFNLGGRLYSDLKLDGRIGPITLSALGTFLEHRRHDDGENTMLKALNALQGARYIELAKARAKDESFVFGWLRNRVTV